ncbi:HipA protein [Herbaspirillum sp. GW103]|nr:HipA protein [Herbaspirillum sp. GW103]
MRPVLQDGQLFEPTGSLASTHIIKPDVPSAHYPSSAVNEWFCARLAQGMGLTVPKVELRYVPSPVYIVERFDRSIEADRVRRLHTLDAAQVLSLSAAASVAHARQHSSSGHQDHGQATRGGGARIVAASSATLILVAKSLHMRKI